MSVIKHQKVDLLRPYKTVDGMGTVCTKYAFYCPGCYIELVAPIHGEGQTCPACETRMIAYHDYVYVGDDFAEIRKHIKQIKLN